MGHNLLARAPEDQRRIMKHVADFAAEDTLPARIAARYPLQQFKEAVTHASSTGANRNGKVIFVP